MSTLDFRDIAQLLNYSRTTVIDLSPIQAKEGRWAVYKGTHKIHTSSLSFRVLYLFAAASQEDIKAALRTVRNPEDVHVVYPPSLDRNIRVNAEIASVRNKVQGIWTTREYLVSFIKEEIQTYLKKLADQAPHDYIDPRVDTPSGFPRKIPNPLLSFLRDPETEKGIGKLGILLAEPGQGKTYMSRYLVSRISEVDKGLVPLMVDSSQWHTMPIEDQRSLSKTIAHSFRHFGAAIGWLEGHENDFLTATLKADLFRIVFDGFDEYILRNMGAVQPLEVLETLVELAKTTGTRIVITSRTSFWNTNLPEAEVGAFIKRTGSLVFTILPFDLEHATNYFKRRLPDVTKVVHALHIYNALKQKNDDFVGRGFVLSLIADLANQGGDTQRQVEASKAMLWLIQALCEREQLRQQLPFTSQEQMDLLSTFAIEVAEGGTPNTELLELAMNVVRPTLDSGSFQPTIEKLKSHPLLEKDAVQDVWSFRQDLLRIFLLAEEVVKWKTDKLERFVSKAKLDPASWQDLGTTIVDTLRVELTDENALLRLEKIIGSMSVVHDFQTGNLVRTVEGCKLAGIVAVTAVERFLPRGSSHQERTQLLLRLCGRTSIKDLSFSGTMARYDFVGTHFDRCRFERVAWASCRFDDNTVFSQCHFVGAVPPAQCEGLGRVQLINCRLDPEAEAIFNSLRVKEGKKKYSTEDLRADMHSVIGKFIIKGGIGLKSVEARNLTKGPISASRYRDDILEVLIATVLEEHHISGASGGYNVREDAVEAVKFYAANNVFTGVLREAFEKLQKKLLLT